jgi:hypothetical protein
LRFIAEPPFAGAAWLARLVRILRLLLLPGFWLLSPSCLPLARVFRIDGTKRSMERKGDTERWL